MTEQETREALFRAAKLRMPTFQRDESSSGRVERLEDYMLSTAVARAELEEGRLYLHEALHALLGEWDDIQGWETLMPDKKNSTQEDVRRAKKTLAPDLHAGIRDARHLIARCSDQIRRLEKDDDVASRAYTFIAGA